MASGAVFGAIKNYLAGTGAVAAAWTTTPMRWENEPFDIPATAWVDVEMTGNFYGQETMGAETQATNRWDESGTLILHVMVPLNTGGLTARTYAKTLADLFRGKTLLSDSLCFGDAFIGRGQSGIEDGGWYRVTVFIEWLRIEA